MTGSRTLIVGALAAVGLVAAFWFLALAPKREESARLQGEIDTTRAAVTQVRTQIATLETAERSYATNYASIARLGKAVPADDDVRSLIVQLDAVAKRSAVEFHSIELDDSGAAPAATGSATASQAVAATLPPGAKVGPAGLPTMPFSFRFDGSFFTLADFFARLKRFVKARDDQVAVTGRLLAVDGFTLEPGTTGFPAVKASVGATAYLVPKEEGATGGATPAGPATAVATPGAGAAATPPPAALSPNGGTR